MITEIISLPENLIGFEAKGEVTADDFKNVVIPKVTAFIDRHDKINYMLVLNTDVSNFTTGAWLQDAWLGLKDLAKWNRAAIVSDNDTIKKITEVFTKVMPGEFKIFEHNRYNEAVQWASEQLDL
ncbi:SpoIIAA family protein [Sphingobacterium pedocola]|uniref:STAS/SEC14 domain-containing protein n=1 Tax=Sphingobacterium pedocola TaxID=2082722 RepID=A0ABR9T8A9_9SPHI|nr:STAS/SEC14 domain-containing protein [Sphingobacterium pedocola]MBE8721242.1 STAS/SEC14 domain-containing protein [Sphingobacterium pedocola]